MNKFITILVWCVALPVLAYLIGRNDEKSVQQTTTSSPIEEMYHRQLVTTLDSILDARFSAGCCEEVIDSDDVSVPIDSLGRVIIPKD